MADIVCYHPRMNREYLEEKKKALQEAFDKQEKIKVEAETEQTRLSGEYRLVEELQTTFFPETEEVTE